MPGYAIILNGPSSSGKSTVAKAIQATRKEQGDFVLHFTMDQFLAMIPKGVTTNKQNFPNLVAAIGDCAGVLLNSGHNLAIDVIFQPSAMGVLRDRLKAFDTFAVGFQTPLNVREAWEKARGDRFIGLTAEQEGTIHGDTHYDLELDTSTMAPEDAAARVMAAYDAPSLRVVTPAQPGAPRPV